VLLHKVIHIVLKVIHIHPILFANIKKEILRRKD